ncbi:pyroglutamyl-peptidase I [Sporosarcina sp. YIM B06819]|uniref:pyroglutamyl-peptidase I n=1 Tax=Sporosarcina sp. YIM B06819 TaxID=3081769 RepID=UPI00298C7B2C|nr:pyroglutamyl-peptidase I [Sporosarcina sp. YIM B06819]
MKTLLLTGFEPFLSYTVNPTMKIVEELHGMVIGNYKIHSEVLTVDFQSSGEQILKSIAAVQPDAVLSLGLAGGRYKMTPERIAINVKDGGPDNNGYKPVDEVIQAEGQAGYMATLPVRAMVNGLVEAGLPAEVSDTAGTYLCNNVMYEALHYAATQRPTMKSGFLHIPASHELAIQHGKIPSWSHEDLKKGVVVCIEALAADEA